MTSYYIFWCSCFCCPFVADFLAIIFFPIKCSIDFLKQLNFASVIIWFMNRNILRELNLENLKKSSVSAPQIISLIYMNGSVSHKVESGRSRNDRVEWKWQFPFSRQERPLFRKDHHNLFHQAMPDSCQPVSIFLFLYLNNVWILLPSILGHVNCCLYTHCMLINGAKCWLSFIGKLRQN